MSDTHMPVLTRGVTFEDGHGRDRTVEVPSDEWHLGPPEVRTDGWVSFGARSGEDQDKAWRRWFQAGNELSILEKAREQVAEVNSGNPPRPLAPSDLSTTYAATNFEPVRAPAFVDGRPGVPGEDVDHQLAHTDYIVGPPDLGGAYDPGFAKLDKAERDRRWAAWLPHHEYVADLVSVWRQHQYLDMLQDLMAQAPVSQQPGMGAPDPADVPRALDLLRAARDHPATKWASLVLGLLAIGCTIGLPLKYVPGIPGNVRATPGSKDSSGSHVTITWTQPETGPQPEYYRVTLVPKTGTGGPLAARTADGKATSTVVDDVPDGSYRVEVVAEGAEHSGAAGTADVTVPGPAEQTPSTRPDPPTGVTLTAGMSATSREHGLTVVWTPPAAGPAPTGYTVRLIPVAPAGMSMMATAGLMTSAFFGSPTDGTYRADVLASNQKGDSAPASSGVTTYAAPTLPPDAPGSPRVNVTKSAIVGGNAKLVVGWARPATGPDVVGYQVTLTGGGRKDTTPTQTGSMMGTVYDPIGDGTYTVTVVAYNKVGKGPAATTSVTVDHTTIDPNGLDWAPVFGADQIREWKAQRSILNDMDEQAEFWPHVLRVLEDEKNEHGGLASYETMLFLARLLSRWIAAPAVDPAEPVIRDIAAKISAGSTPVFPAAPPAAGAEYTKRLEPWKAAQNVPNYVGAQQPLRYKMFGLVRVLERYLGVHT